MFICKLQFKSELNAMQLRSTPYYQSWQTLPRENRSKKDMGHSGDLHRTGLDITIDWPSADECIQLWWLDNTLHGSMIITFSNPRSPSEANFTDFQRKENSKAKMSKSALV